MWSLNIRTFKRRCRQHVLNFISYFQAFLYENMERYLSSLLVMAVILVLQTLMIQCQRMQYYCNLWKKVKTINLSTLLMHSVEMSLFIRLHSASLHTIPSSPSVQLLHTTLMFGMEATKLNSKVLQSWDCVLFYMQPKEAKMQNFFGDRKESQGKYRGEL